jgi:hypothetical protein
MTRALGRAGMLLVLALVFAAPAAANHVQCGDVITTDTTLDSDLTCTGDGLSVEADGVTIDLAGHVIDGSGTARGIVDWIGNDTVVHGGTIRDFQLGIDADGPDGLLVHDMLFQGNGSGVSCNYAGGCSVLDSTLRNNGVGIRMNAPDGGSSLRSFVQRNDLRGNSVGLRLIEYLATVTDNRMEHNSSLGVQIDNNALVQMSRNHVASNGGDGITVSFLSHATISDNRIEGNAGNGVGVFGDHFFENTDATVTDNRIARNGSDGVLVLADGAHAVIEGNQTDRNGDDGIDVRFRAGVSGFTVDAVVRANKAYSNGDLGIHALPGTTDGGGNKARHNGNPAQCVGVTCK